MHAYGCMRQQETSNQEKLVQGVSESFGERKIIPLTQGAFSSSFKMIHTLKARSGQDPPTNTDSPIFVPITWVDGLGQREKVGVEEALSFFYSLLFLSHFHFGSRINGLNLAPVEGSSSSSPARRTQRDKLGTRNDFHSPSNSA